MTCSAGVLIGQRGSARADGISECEANGISGHPQQAWLPATPISTTVGPQVPVHLPPTVSSVAAVYVPVGVEAAADTVN